MSGLFNLAYVLEVHPRWGKWDLFNPFIQSHSSHEANLVFGSRYVFGEGNGNPLQCSCLENPRDGGTWWAAVYGVAQSQTRLRRQQQQVNVRASLVAQLVKNPQAVQETWVRSLGREVP